MDPMLPDIFDRVLALVGDGALMFMGPISKGQPRPGSAEIGAMYYDENTGEEIVWVGRWMVLGTR